MVQAGIVACIQMDAISQIATVDFASWLQRELDSREWSQAELARRSGLKSAQISRVLNRERKVTLWFCRKVAPALEMQEADVLKAAGLLEITTGKGGDAYMDRLMSLLPLLTREDKLDLLDLAEAKLERRRGRRG